MLEEQAIDSFLANIDKEDDLYVPLMAMLRADGFEKVHLIDGIYEFGKDIIAQKVEDGKIVQYLFPVKKGDLTESLWQTVRGQINECIDMNIGHADFDAKATRRIVVAFSGVMSGKAPIHTQQFKENTATKLGITIDFWDRSRLKDLLKSDHCIGSKTDWTGLAASINELRNGASLARTESISAVWARNAKSVADVLRFFLELSVLTVSLRAAKLRLHAYFLTLGFLRAVVVSESNNILDAETANQFYELINLSIARYATEIIQWFEKLSPEARIKEMHRRTGSELAEFGARTLMFMQIVSLALLSGALTEEQANIVKEFIQYGMSLGATHRPMSDNFATCILVIAVACHKLKIDYEPWLQAIVDWIHEAYEGGSPGLAACGATESEELWRTIGSAIEHPDYSQTKNSTMAAVLLDILSVLRSESPYNYAIQAFKAVSINALRTIPAKTPDELFLDEKGCHLVVSSDYSETWKGDEGWMNSPNHKLAAKKRQFDEHGQSWIGLALSALLRDRWWLASCLELLGKDLTHRAAGSGASGPIKKRTKVKPSTNVSNAKK